VNFDPLAYQQSAEGLGERELGRFRDGIGRHDRQARKASNRENVDDRSARVAQQWQEGLDHAMRAENVHGQVLFEHGGITEVVEDPETGVVDQDVKRLDALDGRVDLRP
jgi:hypothetical protein